MASVTRKSQTKQGAAQAAPTTKPAPQNVPGKMENPAVLIGRLGQNPDITFTANGNTKTVFEIALYAGKVKDSEDKLTEWVRVTTWKTAAEWCSKHLNKGMKVKCGGLLNLQMWENDDGEVHGKICLTAFEVNEIE